MDLTFADDWDESYRSDRDFWDNLELGRLYWFRGTRVLGIAISDPELESPLIDDVSHPGHGTGTSHAVLTRDPQAIIVMVETNSRRVDLPPFLDLQYVTRGITWASEQPWIDVISISLGYPAGIPWEGLEDVPAATRAAVEQGKIVVAGTGNDATPSLTNQIGGPPWVVKAGGVDPAQQGEIVLASKTPDFVADYIGHYACNRSMDELCEQMGTSFSTPLVAGSFARAIRELREAAGHDGGIRDGLLVDAGGVQVGSLVLREAFNRSAAYWNTTDYAPGVPATGPDPILTPFRVAAPVLPAPWVQMGWGYVGPELGAGVASMLLAGDGAEGKPAEAVAHMEALDAVRWAYWADEARR